MISQLLEVAADTAMSAAGTGSFKKSKKKVKSPNAVKLYEERHFVEYANKEDQGKKGSTAEDKEAEDELVPVEAMTSKSKGNIFPINLDSKTAMQAMIYSEIFGKPRCKRRRRW